MPKAAEWKEHIERCEESGQSIAEYCETHELGAKSMTWWRSELRRREREGRTGHRQKKAAKKTKATAPAKNSSVKLAKVIRRTPKTPEGSAKPSPLRVAIAGAEIFVDGSCDRRLLADVVTVLRGGAQ